MAMAATAMASDWNFYGSARVKVFQNEAAYNSSLITTVTTSDVGLQADSVIGAKIKASDKLTAQFEYGVNATNPTLRILAANYSMGCCVLTVGQAYGPLNYFLSNQAWGDDFKLFGVGGIYTGYAPLIQIATMGAKVAILKKAITTTDEASRLQIAYDLPINNDYTIKLFGSYVNSEAYLIGVGDQLKVMDKLTVGGDIFISKNPDKVGIVNVECTAANNSTADSVYGGIAVGKYQISSELATEVGVGYYKNKASDAYSAYYIQLPYAMDSLSIVPEYGNYNKKYYYGVKLQINF